MGSQLDTSELQTAILEAAKAGKESDVARLLALNPSLVDARAPTGQRTPLHLAARNGHDGVVAQLLALSPQSSDARDTEGRTALHIAAEHGHDKIVARLLAHNPALINTVTFGNMTAMHFAAFTGHESTVVQLLNHCPGLIDMKAGVNKTDTALHLAASEGHVKVVAELLARRPSSLADKDWDDRTPVFRAASEGHREVMDLFPLTTDQVHHRDKYGNTLLHLVIGVASRSKYHKSALIQRVWEMNPDALFVANAHGWMPFGNAISSVNEWAIEYFQWKLSMWSIEEALAKVTQIWAFNIFEIEVLQRQEQRFREVVQGECERPLLLSLPRDCVRLIISDYLFVSGSILGGLEARKSDR